MSLDITLKREIFNLAGKHVGAQYLFELNITHNLNTMAKESGLYAPMWQPKEDYARDVIPALIKGIQFLVDNQEEMEDHSPENNWGCYDNLLDGAIDYLCACLRNPDAEIVISR